MFKLMSVALLFITSASAYQLDWYATVNGKIQFCAINSKFQKTWTGPLTTVNLTHIPSVGGTITIIDDTGTFVGTYTMAQVKFTNKYPKTVFEQSTMTGYIIATGKYTAIGTTEAEDATYSFTVTDYAKRQNSNIISWTIKTKSDKYVMLTTPPTTTPSLNVVGYTISEPFNGTIEIEKK